MQVCLNLHWLVCRVRAGSRQTTKKTSRGVEVDKAKTSTFAPQRWAAELESGERNVFNVLSASTHKPFLSRAGGLLT